MPVREDRFFYTSPPISRKCGTTTLQGWKMTSPQPLSRGDVDLTPTPLPGGEGLLNQVINKSGYGKYREI